jgi:outer membrane murein-binding lipoprotein Lpp
MPEPATKSGSVSPHDNSFSSYEELAAQNKELAAQNKELAAQNAQLLEQIHQMREEMQALRDEIARLKKQKPKPNIGPSKMDGKQKKNGKKRKRKKKAPLRANETKIVKAENVPAGSEFKGYADFFVQELVIKSVTTCYQREQWLTPDGKTLTAELNFESEAPHFGPTMCSFVLYQYYHAQVTEPLILEQLREWGVRISSGQLHRIITEGKEKFHEEKEEILKVGLRVSGHIHVDDTGARHQGKNGYCTHIGNEWFAWFESTHSKSRINFLELLRAGRTEYVLSGEAFEYMVAQKLPKEQLEKLTADMERVFSNKAVWQAYLKCLGITQERHVRIVTEGALLGAAFRNGINPELVIVSDDAGQFNVLLHALCWIHAERILAKLVGFNDMQREALEQIRTAVWALYRDLKAYQEKPTAKVKREIEQCFDEICKTQTCFATLNNALKRMHKNKAELLLALKRPDLPLHNNLSECDIREYVKRRKISGGTRSENGRKGRDTFASLKKTCRKLKVSFWEFLNDRVGNKNIIPPLPKLIECRAQST